jgi:hypothetical protein
MADLEKQLTERLYRAFCPDPLALSEYAAGRAKSARSREIRRHLKQCPHCSRELAQWKEFSAAVSEDLKEPAAGLANALDVWIARLIPAFPFSPDAPAMAVRGEDAGLRRYQAGQAQLALEVQEDLEGSGNFAIVGLVTGIATTALRAYLWQAGRLVAETSIDELGNLAFSGLAPGVYELILGGETVEIHVQGFQV